jgi:uncharacterized protein (TIGR02271 family)
MTCGESTSGVAWWFVHLPAAWVVPCSGPSSLCDLAVMWLRGSQADLHAELTAQYMGEGACLGPYWVTAALKEPEKEGVTQMLGQEELTQVIGAQMYSADGDKIGRVGQVYLDDYSQQPQWLTVNTGLFGTNESFVPIDQAEFSGDRVTVPFSKDHVKDAPNVAADGHISIEEEQALYRHYGLDYGMSTAADATGETSATISHKTSGAPTDDAMTRSEERVDVGTKTETAGRARLRKYVVTENVTQQVPVRKEKAVLEREPITEENVDRATDGPAISEDEHEVTLTEERPVVQKETVPVERVRLGKEEVTEDQTVSETVRKEHIEAEGDVDQR